jgi:hypothetical protein
MCIEINKLIYYFILHVVTDFLMALCHLHPFVTGQYTCTFSKLKCLLANEEYWKEIKSSHFQIKCFNNKY